MKGGRNECKSSKNILIPVSKKNPLTYKKAYVLFYVSLFFIF